MHPVGGPTALHASCIWAARASPAPALPLAAPIFVASNAYLASSYARVILAFIRDWFSRPASARDEPVRVVELGAGCGRLSFLILRELCAAWAAWPDAGSIVRGGADAPFAGRRAPFRVIVTDADARAVDAAAQNEAFSRFVDAGLVDFAVWDAEVGGRVTLRLSGEVLDRGSAAAPVVGIANYVLSALRTSVVHAQAGELSEAHAAVWSIAESDATATPPPRELLHRMRVVWSQERAECVCSGERRRGARAAVCVALTNPPRPVRPPARVYRPPPTPPASVLWPSAASCKRRIVIS
jgi:hypothetical protein